MLRFVTLFRMRTLGMACGIMLLAQASAPAQQSNPLDALVTEALRNNLGLRNERLAADRAATEVGEARGLFLPNASVESRYTRQNGTLNLGDVVNPAFAALNEIRGNHQLPTNLDLTLPLAHDSRFRLSQPLFNESIRRNYGLSQRRLDSHQFRARAAARQLAGDVQIAAISVAEARSAVRILEASLQLVKEGERVATRLVDAGQATPDAMYRARAERSDVEQRLVEARERADAAGWALNQLLARPLDAPPPAVPDESLHIELTISEDEAVAHALTRREELFQLDAEIGAAEEAVGLATASMLPSVAFAVDYGVQGQQLRFGQGEYWMTSVVFSWSVFNGGRDLARRQGATVDAQRARVARRDVEDRIRLRVRQSYSAAKVARAALVPADDRLAAARRTFDLMRRRYEEGDASQIAFLDARTQLTNAELNRSLTAYRYAARYFELQRAAALLALPGGN